MSNNSLSLTLETMYKDFELNMIKYDQEYKNYFSILNNTNHINNYVVLQGNTYWGKSGLKEGAVNTIEECQTMCSTDPQCSGATFKAKSKYCWTRKGEGELMASSSPEDYAIITEIYQSASILYALNLKIIEIIDNIKRINQQNEQMDERVTVEKDINGINLDNKYNILLQQNREIQEILQQYKTVEEEKMDSNLTVRQHSSQYKIFVMIFIILAYAILVMIFDIPGNIISVIYLVICLFTYLLDMTIISTVMFIIFIIYKMLL